MTWIPDSYLKQSILYLKITHKSTNTRVQCQIYKTNKILKSSDLLNSKPHSVNFTSWVSEEKEEELCLDRITSLQTAFNSFLSFWQHLHSTIQRVKGQGHWIFLPALNLFVCRVWNLCRTHHNCKLYQWYHTVDHVTLIPDNFQL